MKRPDVVGLGYCTYDILAIVPGLPDFDDLKMVHLADLTYDGGGQVGTALAALARLGASTGYVGLLGDDAEGRWLRKRFIASGVGVSRLRVMADAGTNICLLLVDQATARRAILCHQRTHPSALTLDEADRDYVQSARVLHLDGQYMPAAIQAAHWAKEAGVSVCFDGNHPRPGLNELLPMVDWLIVAETFPTKYTGNPDARAAAEELLELGADLIVVTQGNHGCSVYTGTEQFHTPALDVQAIDTTGAGDAFHGAFIYALLQGWQLRRAAAFANAAAAQNCLTLGGRRGLPTLHQILQAMGEAPTDE